MMHVTGRIVNIIENHNYLNTFAINKWCAVNIPKSEFTIAGQITCAAKIQSLNLVRAKGKRCFQSGVGYLQYSIYLRICVFCINSIILSFLGDIYISYETHVSPLTVVKYHNTLVLFTFFANFSGISCCKLEAMCIIARYLHRFSRTGNKLVEIISYKCSYKC